MGDYPLGGKAGGHEARPWEVAFGIALFNQVIDDRPTGICRDFQLI